MQEKIYLSSPHMGGQEIKYIQEAFDTNWISPVGPNIDGFERDLSEYTDGLNVAALSSGTAAIHLALIILGVQQTDEVICSSFTFAGSCNPIVYLGATPVFVDSEEETWNMDPELLRKAIEDRISKGKTPKAIVVVHLYGMPAKMDELMSIAEQYGIPVIEDAAEGVGSTYHGKKLGTFGDIGIFSFNGNKIITTSGGGAFLSRNVDFVQKARFLSTQARDNAPHYEHSQIGYNYRMSNVCAGIGRGQMEVLDQHILLRRKNFDFYRDLLGVFSGVSFLLERANTFSNRWLTTALINPEETGGISREDLRLALEEENIESRPLWKPMHLQPVFTGAPFYGTGVSESLFINGICLPSGSNMNESQLQRVKSVLLRLFS
ncbi:aminotransferase class I/II-fold pyridoxal phosphate-dependent enzyme [Fulvivirga sp. 29W222]|uniref:GDP-perosamine synthase n=1 Tax=Fulvivirga marina TaxID=2494733 RepID=A0A937FUM1_9BACT|nr:DegT/DnrJ/EryC1/StrS family aminotransferase [Fulvivirga marina]MBL6444777.1 aminotransferase class I/II-fold pyridoxal phosphate-dependent enzyme [Fulvivirga marina]